MAPSILLSLPIQKTTLRYTACPRWTITLERGCKALTETTTSRTGPTRTASAPLSACVREQGRPWRRCQRRCRQDECHLALKRYLARSPWSWAWEWRFGSEETEESFAGFAGGNDVGYARTHWVAMVGGGRVWCCLLLDEVAEESVGSWDAASCFPS